MLLALAAASKSTVFQQSPRVRNGQAIYFNLAEKFLPGRAKPRRCHNQNSSMAAMMATLYPAAGTGVNKNARNS